MTTLTRPVVFPALITQQYSKPQLIGSGGFGEVYVARRRSTALNIPAQKVAIKRIEYRAHDNVQVVHLMREITLLRRLQHPNLVTGYDVVLQEQWNEAEASVSHVALTDSDALNDAANDDMMSPQPTDSLAANAPVIAVDQLPSQNAQVSNAGDVLTRPKEAAPPAPLDNGMAPAATAAVSRPCYMYMILEHVDTDLSRVIRSTQQLTTSHIRIIIYQLLKALDYMHSLNITHRDIKPSNILIDSSCNVKVCDLGLARVVHDEYMQTKRSRQQAAEGSKSEAEAGDIPADDIDLFNDYGPPRFTTDCLTEQIGSRWYRAPEVYLAPGRYNGATCDLWSAGCVLAELIGRKPVFAGKDNLEQLQLMVQALGKPSYSDLSVYPESSLKNYVLNLPIKRKNLLSSAVAEWQSSHYPFADAAALDLLSQLLTFDPQQRCSAAEALQHPFFQSIHNNDQHALSSSTNLHQLKQQLAETFDWDQPALRNDSSAISDLLNRCVNMSGLWSDSAPVFRRELSLNGQSAQVHANRRSDERITAVADHALGVQSQRPRASSYKDLAPIIGQPHAVKAKAAPSVLASLRNPFKNGNPAPDVAAPSTRLKTSSSARVAGSSKRATPRDLSMLTSLRFNSNNSTDDTPTAGLAPRPRDHKASIAGKVNNIFAAFNLRDDGPSSQNAALSKADTSSYLQSQTNKASRRPVGLLQPIDRTAAASNNSADSSPVSSIRNMLSTQARRQR